MSMATVRRRFQGANDDGWVMPTVVGVLMVVSLMSVAAFATTTDDIKGGTDDVQAKQAYAAAEAGIQAYAYELSRNPEFHLQCDQATGIKVNQRVPPGGARQWTTLPDASAQYAIEILPAPNKTACIVDDEESIVDPVAGTFRIRVTGRARSGAKARSLIATFRKPSFADYVYFTDNEGSNIRFVTGDTVKGPLHTNDRVMICGQPRFGEGPGDVVETVQPGTTGNGWTPDGACSGNRPMANGVPGFPALPPADAATLGTWVHPAPALELPASNSELRAMTLEAYRFRGEAWFTFTNNGKMTVTGTREDGVTYNGTSVDMPPNGLIYVSNGTCPGPYQPNNPYASDRNGPGKCGTAWVSGTYNRSVTVAAQADIVVFGNLVRANSSVVGGLISNNFIRVYHPIVGGNASCSAGSSNASVPAAAQDKRPAHPMPLPLHDLQIQAAILSLQQSFTVDSYMCGPRLSGTLNVTGAIAQKTRGAVGTSGGSGTGYLKNYVYDRRLRFRTPPSFLDPVRSAWRLASQQEQIPAQ